MTCDCVNVKLCVDPADLNLPEKASIEETVAGLDDAKYTTPAGVAAAIAESACDCPPGGTGTGMRVWESDWFDIAASRAYTFQHNLNLASPWTCSPRLVARVKTAQANWAVGDIIFAEGSNYIGDTANQEIGWAVSLSADTVHVTFGNFGSFMGNNKNGGHLGISKSNVECKLVFYY